MALSVTLVGTPEVITGPTGPFVLNPNPTTPLFSNEPRTATSPILYETISPTMTITATATGFCPPAPVPVPNLITSIAIFPGQAQNSGTGCSITKLADLADRPVTNLPDYQLPIFNEPYMQYGSFAGPPSATMSLVTPLRGLYGEKYFYDSEYIYASYEKGQFNGKTPTSPSKENRLTSINLLKGKQTIPFSALPEGIDSISTDLFTGPASPIVLSNLEPDSVNQAISIGSDYLYTNAVPEASSWVKWRPSFIEVMTYYYHVVVTHTCPPFVTTFQGSMTVQNNWTPAASRLAYYIGLQKGFLDAVT